MIFRKSRKYKSITKFTYSNESYLIENLTNEIKSIDSQIVDTTRTIFEAQMVRARSIFSGKQNFIGNFQKKFVENAASSSVSWHQRRLIELNSQRQSLQDQLDRLTGKYWQKKLLRLIALISSFGLLLVILCILLMGLFGAIYLLPYFLIGGLIIVFLRRFRTGSRKY